MSVSCLYPRSGLLGSTPGLGRHRVSENSGPPWTLVELCNWRLGPSRPRQSLRPSRRHRQSPLCLSGLLDALERRRPRYSHSGASQSGVREVAVADKMKFMAAHRPHLKIRRAKAVVYNDGKRVLTICEICGMDVYLLKGQTVCTECRTTNRRRLIRVRRSKP